MTKSTPRYVDDNGKLAQNDPEAEDGIRQIAKSPPWLAKALNMLRSDEADRDEFRQGEAGKP